jgi:hypothetical protein
MLTTAVRAVIRSPCVFEPIPPVTLDKTTRSREGACCVVERQSNVEQPPQTAAYANLTLRVAIALPST